MLIGMLLGAKAASLSSFVQISCRRKWPNKEGQRSRGWASCRGEDGGGEGALGARVRPLFWRKSHFSLVCSLESLFEEHLVFFSLIFRADPCWQTLTKKLRTVHNTMSEVPPGLSLTTPSCLPRKVSAILWPQDTSGYLCPWPGKWKRTKQMSTLSWANDRHMLHQRQ